MRTKTIDLKGKQYAQVKDRIVEFRKDNSRGLIETSFTTQPDGSLVFKARILKDKSDEHSAEATGHAMGKKSGEKEFEKLESIAVGRALALLGYATDGEIASSEEMEEFEDYKNHKYEEAKTYAMEALDASTDLEDLKTVWKSLGAYQGDKDVIALKDKLKLKFDEDTKTRTELPRVVRSKERKNNGLKA